MVLNRIGESGYKIPLRTDRFFAVNSKWYFSTREGISIGPFTDKKEATIGLNDFIEYMSITKSKDASRSLFT